MAEESEPNGKLPVLRSAALHVHDRSGESRKELERLSNTLELWHREQAQKGRTVESRLRKLGDDAKKRVAIKHKISGLKEARRRSPLGSGRRFRGTSLRVTSRTSTGSALWGTSWTTTTTAKPAWRWRTRGRPTSPRTLCYSSGLGRFYSGLSLRRRERKKGALTSALLTLAY